MARVNDNPRKFIISCRVNHREMQELHERARESGLSITALLRECLDFPEEAGRKQNQSCA